jgi:hypothetical protein
MNVFSSHIIRSLLVDITLQSPSRRPLLVEILVQAGNNELNNSFEEYICAINVLKQGKSYNSLVRIFFQFYEFQTKV